MNNFCTPNNINNNFTCFSNNALKNIATAYNNQYKDAIEIPRVIQKKTRKVLWENIQDKMKKFTPCDKDFCLLNTKLVQEIDDDEIHKETFRPEMPETWYGNMTAWLSTVDIKRVMKQYEQKYSDFYFIGPVPIDFNEEIGFGVCISNELCKIDLNKLFKKGIRRLGMVFNLDPHYKGGSHWVSMFVNLNTAGIYFFDSYGIAPRTEINELMEKLKEQGNKLLQSKKLDINKLENLHTEDYMFTKIDDHTLQLDDTKNFYVGSIVYFTGSTEHSNHSINTVSNVTNTTIELKNKIKCSKCNKLVLKSFRTFFNNVKFQFKGSECGVYSMHFIEEFLNGKNFNEIITNVFHDDEINKKRYFYYRPNITAE